MKKSPQTLLLPSCSYDQRAYRFTFARNLDGDQMDVLWWNDGGCGPGVLEIDHGPDWRGDGRWTRADDAGYMGSLVALKEMLMNTSQTFPQLNTGKKKGGKKGKRGC